MNSTHVTPTPDQPAPPTSGTAVGVPPPAPGSDPNACNLYDLRFADWFQRHGWQIHQTPGGISVWTNGDARCPYKVTRGMIERLEWNGHIERIFPRDAATLDYVWAASDQNTKITNSGA